MGLEVGYTAYKLAQLAQLRAANSSRLELVKLEQHFDDEGNNLAEDYCCGRSEVTSAWGVYFQFAGLREQSESAIEATVPVFRKDLDGWYLLVVRNNNIKDSFDKYDYYLVSPEYIEKLHPSLLKPSGFDWATTGYYYLNKLRYVSFEDFTEPVLAAIENHRDSIESQMRYYADKIKSIKDEIHETRERQYLAQNDMEFNNIEKVVRSLKQDLEDVMQEKADFNEDDSYEQSQVGAMERLITQIKDNFLDKKEYIIIPFYSY